MWEGPQGTWLLNLFVCHCLRCPFHPAFKHFGPVSVHELLWLPTQFLTYTAVLVCGYVNRFQAECLSCVALSCVRERLLLLCEWIFFHYVQMLFYER